MTNEIQTAHAQPAPDRSLRGLIRRSLGLPARWAALCAALLPLAASAQTSRPADADDDFFLTAGDELVWLVHARNDGSLLYARDLRQPFSPGRSVNRRVAMAAASGDALYLLFSDNSLFRYTAAGSVPEQSLPDRSRPIALAADANTLYALVAAETAETMKARSGQDEAASTQPSDALLWLAAYDGGEWRKLVPAPAACRPDARPRLLAARDALTLVWSPPASETIENRHFHLKSAQWRPGVSLDVPLLLDFWPVMLEREAALVAVTKSVDGVDAGAFRWLGDQWRTIELHVSPLPDGVHPASYTAAAAVQQRVALLARDARGVAYLQYGRRNADPTEPTLPLATGLQVQRQPPIPNEYRQLIVLALFMLLAGMIFLRRESLSNPVELPPEATLAWPWQRAVAWIIDFAPFAVGAAVAAKISAADCLAGLFDWAVRSDVGEKSVPASELFLWWLLSAGGHAVYSFVLELATGRTIGKLIVGVKIVNESGHRPAAAQVAIRNLLRAIELYPPFLAILLMALLTRNRQRLGDVFARTVVVRPAIRIHEGAGQKATAPADAADDDAPEPPASSD